MSLLASWLFSMTTYFRDNQVTIRVIGQSWRLPSSVQDVLHSLQQHHHNWGNDRPISVPDPSSRNAGAGSGAGAGAGRTLCLAISYGGRLDITGDTLTSLPPPLLVVSSYPSSTHIRAAATVLLYI